MLFYLLAIPYALMRWNGAALNVGAGLINLVTAVGIVGLVARRAGGKAALATAAIVCAFEFILSAPNLTNSWGPEVIVLPVTLFFVLCADLAAGAVWSLVGAVVVGSFLAQTEVGTASAVGVGLLLAVVARGVAWLKAGTLRQSLGAAKWAGLATLIIGGVIWTPTFWQQLTGDPGNLGEVVKSLLHMNGHQRPADAVSALARGVADPLFGADGQRSTAHPSVAMLAIFLIAAGGLAVVCWWRRQWLACALAGGILPIVGVCLLSLLHVKGPIFTYLVVWMGALTVCGGIALVICLTTPARPIFRIQRWGDGARLFSAFAPGRMCRSLRLAALRLGRPGETPIRECHQRDRGH